MKLHLIDRSSQHFSSFAAKKNQYPYFLKMWHYHPELELVLLIKSTGTRFIGDSIEKFEEGELILIGENLPHMWLNDDEYHQQPPTLTAEAIAIHFRKDFLGSNFFDIPEMKKISKLLIRANQGIHFLNIPSQIIADIKEIVELSDFERIIKLIRILNKLSSHTDFRLLSSKGFMNTFGESTTGNRLDSVYEYVFKNFNKPIQLKDVANIANMNASAFSRFFKRMNRKTFSKYLNEIRIGFACKMLIEEKYNISTICYQSGYNNISNFNRQFKKIKKVSPSEYILQYKKISPIPQR
jgi:AraC-like DNA-binding protein